MLWRAVYALASRAVLPLVFGYFIWRGRREPSYRHHWRERLGYRPTRHDAPIWIHAASVGEVMLAAPLIEALYREQEAAILLTTMTPTGRAEARRRFADGLAVSYVPLDTPGATRRFIARVKPRLGVIVETEIWPHLIDAAAGTRCPLALINATLSPRSAQRYRTTPAAATVGRALARIDWIAAASADDAERLVAAGAHVERVATLGNLKYDVAWPADLHERAATQRRGWQAETRPVWVAASTHEGEERLLLDVFERLRARWPDLLWVLAPRHPQRFDTVAALLETSGHVVSRRSEETGDSPAGDIVLADTLGEVPLFYALADVAFVGGSLVPGIGGHNVIEPAALGCVFVVGPYADDWQGPLAEFAEGSAVARDPQALVETINGWLSDESARMCASQRIADVAAGHRGALVETCRGLFLLMGHKLEE